MVKADRNNPNNEEVRLIYKDTYNFYLKWKDISSESDWSKLMEEVRSLEHKYEFDLCMNILLSLIDVIETDYKNRTEGDISG